MTYNKCSINGIASGNVFDEDVDIEEVRQIFWWLVYSVCSVYYSVEYY